MGEQTHIYLLLSAEMLKRQQQVHLPLRSWFSEPRVGEMTDARTSAGNIQDEPGEPHRDRKQGRTKQKSDRQKSYIAGCTSASPDLTESTSNVQSRNNVNNEIHTYIYIYIYIIYIYIYIHTHTHTHICIKLMNYRGEIE